MKKHFFWIMELLIWVLILFTVSGFLMLARYHYRKDFNTYQIFLNDVDGLINGSPVRMMGINVGYVNQINIVGENVYVKFILTEKGVKIPQGSIATVEFFGLGGSKSLEIYPPKTKHQHQCGSIIVAQEPKRISDSLGVLMDMFNDIGEITYRVSSFMDKVGVIKDQTALENKKELIGPKVLNNSNNWLDKATEACDNFNKKLKGKKNGSNIYK